MRLPFEGIRQSGVELLKAVLSIERQQLFLIRRFQKDIVNDVNSFCLTKKSIEQQAWHLASEKSKTNHQELQLTFQESPRIGYVFSHDG